MFKKIMVKKIYFFFSTFFFSPVLLYVKLKSIPIYFKNLLLYKKLSKVNNSFKISFSDLFFTTTDKFKSSGNSFGHYFFQDLWAATHLFNEKVTYHVDVASRLDGFIAHILTFSKVDYVDIRKNESSVQNLNFINADILNLPFKNNSINSLSCLHVLEHIGLGRYGDNIDPIGHIKAAKELSRVLKPGGKLYFGTPIGKERLCFDAHRVFNTNTILNLFDNLVLLEFSLIDDSATRVINNADFDYANQQNYGCGLFIFTKN